MDDQTAHDSAWDQVLLAIDRLTTPTAVPGAALLLAAVALGVLLVYWRGTRRIVDLANTIAHEAGHAAAAVLTGRKVAKVHVRGDGSGTTHTYGTRGGFGTFLVSFSGYPFPAAVGAVLIVAAVSGVARATAALLAVALLVLLLRMRNVVGWLAVALGVAGAAAAAWLVPGLWLASGLLVLGTALLVSAVQALLQERRSRRRGPHGSDVENLALDGRFRAPVYWWAMLLTTFGFGSLAVRQVLDVYPPPW